MSNRFATSGDDLTDDLLTEVLLKLPIKFLLRCKSVCKSWLALISSHRFAKSHLLTSAAARDDDQTLIVHLTNYERFDEEDGSFQLFNLGYGDLNKNLLFPYSPDEYYPFVPDSSQLVGCDCGIICVSVDVSDWPAAKNETDIYLWNPATRHSKRIPPHTLLDNDDKMKIGALGFGFDHVDFDFKVLEVIGPTNSARVYSSNKNAWRKIESNPTDTPYFTNFNVCLHGFLFAIGYSDMMAFDLNKEVFVCDIKLPCNYKRPVSVGFCISDFNDSVAVSMYDELDGKLKLWTLNDDACLRDGEVEASWTMMLSIDVGVPVDFVDGLFNSVEFLLRGFNDEQDARLLYNSNNKGTRYVPAFPFFESRQIFKYTESLFSIEGFKRIRCSASL